MLAHQINFDILTTDPPERGTREWFLAKHARKIGRFRGGGRLAKFREISKYRSVTIEQTIRDGMPKVCESEYYFYVWNIGPICIYCGVKLTKETKTVEHVIPRCKGEIPIERDNLMPSCRTCNWAKGDRSLLHWMYIGGIGSRKHQ
jgi:predicted RNA-binding Zn-ribbon protein involved in translation (DUF1610 family)